MIGERLALDEDREERFRPSVDEAPLLEEPRVHVIEQQGGSHRHVDELPPLRAQLGLAPEGGDEFASKGQCFASCRRSAVNRVEPSELDPGHRGVQAVVGVRAGRGHARNHDGATGGQWLDLGVCKPATGLAKECASGGSPRGSTRDSDEAIRVIDGAPQCARRAMLSFRATDTLEAP